LPKRATKALAVNYKSFLQCKLGPIRKVKTNVSDSKRWEKLNRGNVNWFLWRPVLHNPQLASFWEIEEKWSIDELFDAHEIMDVMQIAPDEEQKKTERESKRQK